MREPKFDFRPTARRYGRLDTTNELIECDVINGRLRALSYPKSWETGVNRVGTREEHARVRAHAEETRSEEWQAKYPKMPLAPYPSPTLLLGLNEARDAYEVVYDPHDIAGAIDPMMLLNFRRSL